MSTYVRKSGKVQIPLSRLPRDVRDKPVTSSLAQIPLRHTFPPWHYAETSIDGEVSGNSVSWNLGKKGRHGFVADVTGKSA